MSPLESAILALNGLTLLVMGYDKRAAGKKMWRVPEALLLALAVCGGSAGIWFGMKFFRHKTQKPRFMYGIPLIVSVQAALLLFVSLR
jgi:uncharacterized membrane protein YsdA (DUF1294 family)